MSIISGDISKAARLLREDEVIAIPTETVYGLAGNIYSEKAIKKIFEVKERPLFNPLIVHIHSLEQLNEIAAEVPREALLLANTFWPGPLTLILKKKQSIPDLITAGKDTVAIRMPKHPITIELLKILDFPLAAPSANPFNRISPTSAKHVEKYFKDHIPMVLDGGDCERGLESTIIGFEGSVAVVYRLGSISLEDLERVVGKILIKNNEENAPQAPGMLDKHYAPKTHTVLVKDLSKAIKENTGKKIGVLSFRGIEAVYGVEMQILSKEGDLKEASSNLYRALHLLDEKNLDLILLETLPEEGLGRSINDRLRRAAS